METNALRDEPAQKSAAALVDAGDIAQNEMDGSSLRDRLLCTGLDCAYVLLDNSPSTVIVMSFGSVAVVIRIILMTSRYVMHAGIHERF